MGLPRFHPQEKLRGKHANLIADAIDNAINLPSAIDTTVTTGSALVTSVVGVGDILASPTTGNVIVSSTATGFDLTKVYQARAYTTFSRSTSTTPAVVTLEVIDRDPFAEFDANGAWTASNTGFYIVTARLAFDRNSASSAAYLYINGVEWRAGVLSSSPYITGSSEIFTVGFIGAGSVMKLYGFANAAANIVAGTNETFLEITRIG